MTKLNRISLLIIVINTLLLSSAVLFLFKNYQTTPEYALSKLENAINNRDAETALKYFDIEAVFNNKMRQSVAEIESLEKEDGYPPLFSVAQKGLWLEQKPDVKSKFLKSIADGTNQIFGDIDFDNFKIRITGKYARAKHIGYRAIVYLMIKTDEGYWKIIDFEYD